MTVPNIPVHEYVGRHDRVCDLCGLADRAMTHPLGVHNARLQRQADFDSQDLLTRAETIARLTPLIEPDAGAMETAAMVRALVATITRVTELHKPEQRWQTSPSAECSYDSEAEARDFLDEGQDPTWFWVCHHCGDIEMGLEQRGGYAGDGISYLEALWPCQTMKELAAAGVKIPTPEDWAPTAEIETEPHKDVEEIADDVRSGALEPDPIPRDGNMAFLAHAYGLAHTDCWCWRCESEAKDALHAAGKIKVTEMLSNWMFLCPDCGNKRCDRAAWHENECTGSNEPGQPGSRY